ncbi:MAG: hypothetical protein RLZ71_183 [Actinomycetota bacterium]
MRTSWKLVAIYAASRALTTIWYLIDLALNRATPSARHFDSLLDYMSRYDSQWYRRIAENGYPTELPLASDGSIAANNWAFLPGFPNIVKLAQSTTGLSWGTLAPILATIFGGLFVYAAYKVFRLRFDERTSLWAIAILSFSTAAPALSIGYADSLGLALSAFALYLILKGQYLTSLAPIIALAFTRPGAIVFAAVFLGLAVFGKSHRIRALIAMTVSGLAGICWPLIAWAATGNFNAYFATENAWRKVWTHSEHLSIFQGWFAAFRGYVGPWLGIPLVLVFVFLAIKLVNSESVKKLGLELRLYIGACFFYVFAVFFPQTSTIRILLPAFPLALAVAVATVDEPKRFKAWLLVLLAISQAIWVWVTYSAYPFNLDIAP